MDPEERRAQDAVRERRIEVRVIQARNLIPGYGAVNAHQVAKEHLNEIGDITACRIREVPSA